MEKMVALMGRLSLRNLPDRLKVSGRSRNGMCDGESQRTELNKLYKCGDLQCVLDEVMEEPVGNVHMQDLILSFLPKQKKEDKRKKGEIIGYSSFVGQIAIHMRIRQ